MASYPKKHLIMRRNKLLPQDIQLRFLKQLGRLLGNGYSIIDALEVIKWDKQLITIAEQMIDSLKNGATIDQAFEHIKFHHTITSYLYFVKDNGDLLSSIEKCTEMYENRLKYMRKFKDITRYPLILLFIFSILLYFISEWVLPSFIDIFQSSSEASSMIYFSMMFIEILIKLLLAFFILIIICSLIWFVNKKKFSVVTQIKLYSMLPIYRQYLRLQTSFEFATHLSTQLKTGMPMKEILNNMSKQKKLPIIAHYTSLMTDELSNGFPLTSLLPQLTFFEQQLTIIFQKNTDKHALEKDLGVYADLLTEEIQRKVMKAITMIQPVFFGIIACFVIFIYLTLMWPLLEMIGTI